jgi:hypothetical protein
MVMENVRITKIENYDIEEYSCLCKQSNRRKTYIDAIHLINIIRQKPVLVHITEACCGDDVFTKIRPYLEGCNACFQFDNLSHFVCKYKSTFLENKIRIGKTPNCGEYNTKLVVIDEHKVIYTSDKSCKLGQIVGKTFCEKYLKCLNFITICFFNLLNDLFNVNYIEQLETCVQVSKRILEIFPDEFNTSSVLVDNQFGLVKYFCTLTSFLFLMLTKKDFSIENKFVLQSLPSNNLLVTIYEGRKQTQIYYFQDIYVYDNALFLISQSKKPTMSANLEVEELFYKLIPGCSFIIERLTDDCFEGHSLPVVSCNWMSRLVEYSGKHKNLDKFMCCSLLLMFEYIINNRLHNSPLFDQIYKTSQQIDYIFKLNNLFKQGHLTDWLSDKPQNLVQFHIHWFYHHQITGHLKCDDIFGKHLLSKISPDFPSHSVLARLIEESLQFAQLNSLLCSMRDRNIRQTLIEEYVSRYLLGRPEIETVISSHLPFYGLFSSGGLASTEPVTTSFGVFGDISVRGGLLGKNICTTLVTSMFSDTVNLIQKRCKYRNKF